MNPASTRAAGQRHQPAVPARSVPGQHHPGGPHQPGRAERRQHLPAAERPGQLQQLHVHREPRHDRQRRSRAGSITACRDKDSFFARFNWGKFKLDAPQGQAACCLPTPADAAARFDLGPFVAGIQNTRLTTHGAAFNYSRMISSTLVNELRVGYARTVPFTFQSDFGINAADSLGIRGINVTEFTTGLPNINIPDLTGISGGPAFLPVNPKQFHWQVEDALVWLRGRHSAQVRLPPGRSLPVAVHQHRHARLDQLRPQLHEQPGHQHRRLGHRVAADRLHQQRRARLPARALHAADAGARRCSSRTT